MARSIKIDTVQIYRALVEWRRETGEWKPYAVFGPYVTLAACVDRDARWYRNAYEEGRRRTTRQKLIPAYDNGQLIMKWVNADGPSAVDAG